MSSKEQETTDEEVCEYCHGSGLMPSFGNIYIDEPYLGMIEERPCYCQDLSEEDSRVDEN